MKNYITMSRLTRTEGLGSQMSNFAAMYAISLKTGHRILFRDDVPGNKGLELNQPFDGLPIDVVSDARLTGAERVAYVFELDTSRVVDGRVFELDSNTNYDFLGFFTSYRYWYPAREAVLGVFHFKKEIVAEAAALVGSIKAGGRQIVALHVRRADYLESPYHLNLSLDYYLNACAQFAGGQTTFLVFSDDIAWCRETFRRRTDFSYATQSSMYADLCAMSLCDHNIVANSSFSVWGALLNRSQARRVVCPSRYLKDAAGAHYVNYAWFPDDWIPLDDLVI